MCFSAVSIRFFNVWKLRQEHLQSAFPVNGTHFFLDIGLAGQDTEFTVSKTKHLEDAGWRGVCANPFSTSKRSCKTVSVPVAPISGQEVELTDCTGVRTPFQAVFATTSLECPTVRKTAVSITELLKLSKAPRIIDYVALDTQGSELEILKRFPFGSFCVRAWTVERHSGEARVNAGIRRLLISRSCKVKDAGSVWWARCSCSKFASSLLTQSVAPTRRTKILYKLAKQRIKEKYGRHGRSSAVLTAMDDSPGLMRKN
jgi:hypothetical protein